MRERSNLFSWTKFPTKACHGCFDGSLADFNVRRWLSDKIEGEELSPALTQQLEEENCEIEMNTRAWLKRVVVGMNLCPFAERPMRAGKLKIEVIRGNDEEVILSMVLEELMSRKDTPGTTLIVCPECHPNDFEAYLEVLNMIENGLMVDYDELIGQVQVAPFHPLFQFEGSNVDGVDNWTNRSPYPIFHILREEEVSKAVDRLDGDAGKVWKRNVNLLHTMQEELGKDTFEQILLGQTNDKTIRSKVQAILRRFKVQLGD